MALIVRNVDSFAQDVWGRHRVAIVEVTFDDSYDLGGESFTPADAGMAEFSFVQASVDADSTPGLVVQYDYAAQALVVLGVEQDADDSTTDPLDEAADQTDLEGLTVRVLCVGH